MSMTKKRNHKTLQNRTRRRRRSALCLALLFALCVSAIAGTTAFAEEEATAFSAEETAVSDEEADVLKEETVVPAEESADADGESAIPEGEDADAAEAETDIAYTEIPVEEVETDAVLETYLRDHVDRAYVSSVDSMQIVNGLLVKNTLFDGTYVETNDTIDSILSAMEHGDGQFEKYIAQLSTYVAVYDVSEESDYFVAYANTMQKDAGVRVQDAVFAVNDNSGTALSGCVYDKATGLAYLPKELFADGDTYRVFYAQVQLMQVISGDYETLGSEVDSSVLEGDEADVYQTVSNIFALETTVPTEAGLEESRMLVSVNGIPLDDDSYRYNKTTGEITLEQSSANIQSVAVTVEEETLVSKLKDTFSPLTAYAADSWDSMETLAEDVELPEWVCAGTALSGTAPMTYDSTANRNSEYYHYPAYGYDFNNNGANESDMKKLFNYIQTSWSDNLASKFANAENYVEMSYDVFEAILLGTHTVTSTGKTVTTDLTYDTTYTDGSNRYAGDTEPIGENIPGIDDLGYLLLFCTHVDTELDEEYVAPGYWINGQVLLRFLYVDRAEGIATFAVMTTQMDTQTGGTIVKIGIQSSGYLTLTKSSGDTSLTKGNDNYSLKGAVYTVYTDKACTSVATDMDGNKATLTTNADGTTETLEMALGTYYVKETTAPPGYALDETVKTVTVTAAHTEDVPYTLSCSDTPLYDTLGLTIQKLDAQSGLSEPQGDATLEGAEFTVCFYNGNYTKSEVASLTPTRTWVIATKEIDGIYQAALADDYKVSGDSFYEINGQVILPLGTYTIRETKAPGGYLLTGTFTDENGTSVAAGDVYCTQLTGDNATPHLTGGNVYTATDRVKRGDFTFKKQDGNHQSTMGSVKFRLTSLSTGESHILWTDVNGDYSSASAWEPHSQNTNAGESYEDGIWFYGSSDGASTGVRVDDSLGALPYGTYLLEELPCDANEGRTLIQTQFTVYRDVTDSGSYYNLVDLGTIDNYAYETSEPDPEIDTKLINDWTGEQQATIFENCEISLTDAVTYQGLEIGKTYVLKGTLMDKETGEVLTDAYGEPVTAESEPFEVYCENGMTELAFTFFASGLHGTQAVAFEYLYETEDGVTGDSPIAEHTDLDAESQTVDLLTPTLWTNAMATYSLSNQIDAEEEVSVTDMLYLTDLIPGHTYYVYGRAVDADGNLITDADGNTIELIVGFVATDTEMELDIMQFVFNASGLEGQKIIFEEYLYADAELTVLITEEEDLGAVEETIFFNETVPATPTTSGTTPVKTGDTTAFAAWIVVVAAAGACLLLMLIRWLKRSRFV